MELNDRLMWQEFEKETQHIEKGQGSDSSNSNHDSDSDKILSSTVDDRTRLSGLSTSK